MTTQSPVIVAAAKEAMEAVQATAEKPSNNVSIKAVTDAKVEMTAAITKAIATTPEVQNLTSTETHFWQRRSFWSQVGSGLGGFAAVAVPVIQYLQDHTTDAGTTTISAFGLLVCIWSNYSSYRSRNASTPLGTKPYPQNRG